VIGVRSPAGAKDFSSNLCVQTDSEAHPASCTMGTGGPFPGVKYLIQVIICIKNWLTHDAEYLFSDYSSLLCLLTFISFKFFINL
jgi:hypothetical protein